MPKQYEAIRDEFMKKGMSKDTAQSKAAAIYVSKGKTAKARSGRAKGLKGK